MKSPKRKEKLEKKSAKLLDRANRLTDEGKTVRAGIAAGRADRLTTKMYKKKGGTTTNKIPKGYHKMPDGKIMKDSAHKKTKKK
tara:strand:- start:702 stop:953 length:252 start_codon:yes stop_codon:yes gene_type:complete